MFTIRRTGPPHSPHIMAPDQEQDSARSRAALSDQRTLSCRIGTLLGSSMWSEVRAGLAAQSACLCVPAHRAAAGVRRDHADVLAILTPIWHDKPETARRVTVTDPRRDEVGGRDGLPAGQGVVARIVTGPHEANRQDPHLPMRYDTGRPRAVIRLRISQPRTTSLACPAGLRARRPSPMMDLYRKNAFSTRP